MHLQQIVNWQCDEQHEGYCYTQASTRFYILGHSQVRTHTQEVCEDHVVSKNAANKKTYCVFHILKISNF
jgi:hypothetical protein